MMPKRFLAAIFLSTSVLAGVAGLGALPAQAQVNTGLQQVGQTIVLPSTDPRVIAARIINVVLNERGHELALSVSAACVLVYEKVLEDMDSDIRAQVIEAVRVLDQRIRLQTDLAD